MVATSRRRTVDLTETLQKLQADRNAIPWPKRCELVEQLKGPLAEGVATEPFRSLIHLLAGDPKWEVRKGVALALPGIQDFGIASLVNQLLQDSNRYVVSAAELCIRKRKKAAREAKKRERGIDLVLALYEELEEDHGVAAAEKARRLAERLYDTLIMAIVHELATVLTALKHHTFRLIELEESGQVKHEQLERRLPKMGKQILFIERLVDDMRHYAKPISNERTTVEIADLLTEVRTIVSENLRVRNVSREGVDLRITNPANPSVSVSRRHIVTAIVNLLQNAYDFLPHAEDGRPVGKIGIRVTPKDGQVHLVVKDSGQGIPADDLDEVRQCLPGRTSRQNTGTGFGLCNARRHVEAPRWEAVDR